MNKILALIDLFRKGSAVSNPGAWKNTQIVASLLMSIAMTVKAWGYDTYLTEEQALSIAVGAVALIDVVLTLITSKKVGVLPPKEDHDLPQIVPPNEPEPTPGEGHNFIERN